ALFEQLPRLFLGNADARAAPDDVRIEVFVALARRTFGERPRAPVVRRLGRVLLLDALGDRLVFGGRDVEPRRLVVRQRLDLDRLLGHDVNLRSQGPATGPLGQRLAPKASAPTSASVP